MGEGFSGSSLRAVNKGPEQGCFCLPRCLTDDIVAAASACILCIAMFRDTSENTDAENQLLPALQNSEHSITSQGAKAATLS